MIQKNGILLLFCLVWPLFCCAQTKTVTDTTQCYAEVIRYEVNWNYNRDNSARNTGGLKLVLANGQSATLKAASPEVLSVWLSILDQDPDKGKVYYFKKSDTEGVLLGNIRSPPSPSCP